ncbi:hypothetical protein N799_09930 [Lysobacter arseniciresistens ZS79]|uniref:Uncharacterized protein n=1 Tax=Lysobacter arseniciresistens ZS79 TaxID=913325 RepID=A0A0A0EUG9_9GAMM|nr:hypothetical protein [Lysobacter arseniciresistens]KGM54189.1 hypothetical protein N799_09930 [Lysobacter arseniciresistens ZS79]
MGKIGAWVLVAFVAAGIGFAVGRSRAPPPPPAPIELDFVDPFAATVVAPVATQPSVDPVAAAIDRATAEQARANREAEHRARQDARAAEHRARQDARAAEREARRNRYGY